MNTPPDNVLITSLLLGEEWPYPIQRDPYGVWTNGNEFLSGWYPEPCQYQSPLIAYAYHIIMHVYGDRVPQIPEGWQLESFSQHGDEYIARLEFPESVPWGSRQQKRGVVGRGFTWSLAIKNAIDQTGEGQ